MEDALLAVLRVINIRNIAMYNTTEHDRAR